MWQCHLRSRTATAFPLSNSEQNRLFELEGTYNDHLVQLPDQFRADQKLKHVKGILQMPLKQWQAWGIDHLSRKHVPVLDHRLGKEVLPNVQSEPPLVQLWAIPTLPVTGYQGEELSTSLSTSPPQEAAESNEITSQLYYNTFALLAHPVIEIL